MAEWNWHERLYEIYFLQAEDGIRDYKVTGVQTCALPISSCAFCISISIRCKRCDDSQRCSIIRTSPSKIKPEITPLTKTNHPTGALAEPTTRPAIVAPTNSKIAIVPRANATTEAFIGGREKVGAAAGAGSGVDAGVKLPIGLHSPVLSSGRPSVTATMLPLPSIDRKSV